MRILRWLLLVIVVVGIGVAVYLFKPINDPARNLTLTADAKHGSYVMTLGGCVACHTDTKHNGALLAGGEPLVTPFGSFVPPNITSDPNAGIGKWTLAEFSDALSNGHGPNGQLYPAFPYTSYTRMTDQDLVDLYAALKQVPPVATPAPPHQISFPFNIRLANLAWQNLFFTPGRFEPDASHSALWNRGAYIATGPGHCIECHSPRNMFGAIIKGQEFTGAPKGSVGGRAPALTADALKQFYAEADIEDTLKTGVASSGDDLGGAMAEVVKDSTSKWTDADRHAVAAYLLGQEQ
ncbi:MAG TPA: cytochrome c [Devosiaceae bacterium]|nr:cytochrome c [Devosiaceae bacterium]